MKDGHPFLGDKTILHFQSPLFYLFQYFSMQRAACAIPRMFQMPLNSLLKGRVFWHLMFQMPFFVDFHQFAFAGWVVVWGGFPNPSFLEIILKQNADSFRKKCPSLSAFVWSIEKEFLAVRICENIWRSDLFFSLCGIYRPLGLGR
jgi:hypothetical protein